MKILGRVLHNNTYDKNEAPFLVEVPAHEMRLLLQDSQDRTGILETLLPGNEVLLHRAWGFYNDLMQTVRGLRDIPDNLRKVADILQRNVEVVEVPEKPKKGLIT